MLEYEARKRPALAALIERIGTLTLEQVESVRVPLPWYRKALLELHREESAKTLLREVEGHLDGHVVLGTVPDEVGLVLRWMGGDAYVQIGRSMIEIRHGKLLWMPDKGGIWFETAYGASIPQIVREQAVMVQAATKSEYTKMHKAALSHANPLVDQVIDLSPPQGPMGNLAIYGVKFG